MSTSLVDLKVMSLSQVKIESQRFAQYILAHIDVSVCFPYKELQSALIKTPAEPLELGHIDLFELGRLITRWISLFIQAQD